MKQGVHLILCIAVGFVYYEIFNYLGIPFWAHALSIPVLVYLMIFATNLYSFRIALDFEKIPAKGYGSRIVDLKQHETNLFGLGFKKFDEFYWRTATDAIVYAYTNDTRTVVLCDYHLGAVTFCDLVTNFEGGFSLTTSNTSSAGNIPRSNKKMLQIFHGAVFSEALRNHLIAVEFLKQKGFQVRHWKIHNFRMRFAKAYLSERENTIGLLSPIKLLYWMATNYKIRYMKPIQQQFLAKTLELP